MDYLASLAGSDALDRRGRLRAVFDSLHERGEALLAQLWEGLSRIKGIRLFGPPPSAVRTPTLSFTIVDCPAAEASRQLARRGIFASHGDFYATTVARKLGVSQQGLIRIGCACYSTEDEIARVVDAVREFADPR